MNGDPDADFDTALDSDSAPDSVSVPASDTEADTTPVSDTEADAGVRQEKEPLSGQEDPISEIGSCLPGIYKGKLDGVYRQIDQFKPEIFGDEGVSVEADITIELSRAARDPLFAVEKGALDGYIYSFIPLKATINGVLDCSTGVFSGEISNGSYCWGWETLCAIT